MAEPLRRVEKFPGYKAVIFRRTYPQITGQGGIWDEANELYRSFGAHMREGDKLDAKFPSGAVVAFSHLQHEKTKYEYQGHQITNISFDELTHFTDGQFWYMVSRNRSTCGVRPYIRATCNPDPKSWVAEFIAWWIDQESGYPIPERSGVLRFMFRDDGDVIHWADSKDEIREAFPEAEDTDILSVTFIPASLDDNPELLKKDPGYKARLKALPKIERERLLGGNWKVSEGALIDPAWLRKYSIVGDKYRFLLAGIVHDAPMGRCRRFATIDTAGTSKEKAAVMRGDPPSWSVCGIWDLLPYHTTTWSGQDWTIKNILFLRHVWRAQVAWNQLKVQIPEVLQTWNVNRAYIENAHYGKPLADEIRCCNTELIGPVISGMGDSSEGAKLERAVASGMLAGFEFGKILLPDDNPPWMPPLTRELTVWTGLPKETADQIDMASYASYVTKNHTASWGGVVPTKG